MICTHCGSTVADDALFCSHCDKALSPGKDSDIANISLTRTIEELKIRLRNLEHQFEEAQKRAESPPVRKFTGFTIILFAALAALFAFCFMPYISYFIVTNEKYQFDYITPATPQGHTVSITGSQLINFAGVVNYRFADFSMLWLQPLIAALLAAVALYQIIKLLNSPYPEEAVERRKLVAFLLLVMAAFTAVGVCVQSSLKIDNNHFSDYAGIGYWLFIIMLAIAAVGGIVQIISERRERA